MVDPRFFPSPASLTAGDLAALTGATLRNSGSGGIRISGIAPLDRAGPSDLSFFDNMKYRDAFAATRAGVCFARADAVAHAPAGTALLISPAPYRAYALAVQALYPDRGGSGAVSPQAFIDPSATLGPGCTVDAGAVIGPNATLGKGCWIGPNAVIGQGVVLEDGVRVGANASLSHCVVGRQTRLYPGVRIGQDGFGFAIDPAGFVRVPQLGRVVIGAACEIGANTTIDRGANQDTEIGDGTWIDNLVQIGHNVKIGRGCVIVAQVGIAGSTVLDDYVVLGGQAGVSGHVRIGKGARVAAQSGIMRDVPPGDEQMGSPALPIKSFLRHIAYLKRATKT